MAKNLRVERPARLRRLRAALSAFVQSTTALAACALWLGLAAPGLHLLPGLDALGDRTIAISLQSAVLGIDDGTGRPLAAAATEAALALGLVDANGVLAATRSLRGRATTEPPAPLVILVADGARPPLVPAAPATASLPPSVEAPPAPVSVSVSLPTAADAPPGHPAASPGKKPRQSTTPAPSPVPPVPQAPAVPAPPSRSVQTIQFTSTVPSAAVVGGPAYRAAAVASSGLAVTFEVAAASAGVCTVSGSTVSLVGVGTCAIAGSQIGDRSYLPAPTVRQTFGVGRALQAISFTTTPGAPVVGGAVYVVAATASSGLLVTLSGEPGSGVCTVSGSTVFFLAAGTCRVNADQAGDARHRPAPRVGQVFEVSAADDGGGGGGVIPPAPSLQTINFVSAAPAALVAGPAYVVVAVASSGLPVLLSATPTSAGVCSVSGTTVSFIGAGTCAVAADQPGNASYLPAPQASQSFAVARVPQALSFSMAPPIGATVGGAAYTVGATASSGLPASFSVSAASASVCAVSGATVAFIGSGTCTVDADQFGDATYASAAQVQQTFSVGTAAPSLSLQSISFTSTPPGGAFVGGSSYLVAATASSGLSPTYSAAPASTGVCTVSGATVALVGVGTCIVRADQAGNVSYQPAPQAQQTFAVGLAGQAISFTSTPPAAAFVGGAAYGISAGSSSGLTVSFSAAASSAGVCTVSGSTVSLVGAGTCTVDANQAGNSTYAAAAQVQQSFLVSAPSPSSQTISFVSAAPTGAGIGGTYGAAAAASSGLLVFFSAAPSSAGVCTVSGSTVSFAGAGTCTIRADQAGNASYLPAPQVQQSFGVAAPGPSAQTISFSSTPPAGALVGGADYAVAAVASSGLAVTFSAAPSSAGICAVSGATVSLVGSGTCTVQADQSGSASYQAAAQVQQSFTIGGGPPSLSVQSITFTTTPPGAAAVGAAGYAVGASASSGLPVVFAAAASSAGICTVSGSTVSFVGAGTCIITADQGGDASYQPAPRVQQSFVVNPGAQAISFTSAAPVGATVGDPGYTVAAASGSGLPVAFSIAPASSGICTLAGSAVSLVGAGTCTIRANQAGDAAYQAAAQVLQSFTISPPAPSAQSISFTSTAPTAATLGGATYTVSASASSGLAVAFSAAASSAGICTLSGSTVSFVGAGTCTIQANQVGNGSYAAAPQVQQAFTVSLRTQTISFRSTPPASATVGGSAYMVSATASSGLAVAFSAAASSAGVCTVSGSTVSLGGAGTCTVNANQPGNGSYQAASQVQQSFTISRTAQTIAFTSTAPSGARVAGPTYTVTATASSGLAVTFSVAPGSASVCAVAGSTVFFAAAGTCTILANQAGNGAYQPAAQVQQSFLVAPSPQSITFTSTPPNADKNDPPYTVTATATSGLAVVFSVDAASAGVCSVSGSTVSFSGRGDCTIIASQPGDANWLAAPQVQQSFRVKNHTPG